MGIKWAVAASEHKSGLQRQLDVKAVAALVGGDNPDMSSVFIDDHFGDGETEPVTIGLLSGFVCPVKFFKNARSVFVRNRAA